MWATTQDVTSPERQTAGGRRERFHIPGFVLSSHDKRLVVQCVVFVAPWELSPQMSVCLVQRRAVATDCNGPLHAYVRPNAGKLSTQCGRNEDGPWWDTRATKCEFRLPNIIALVVRLLPCLLFTKATYFLSSRFIQFDVPPKHTSQVNQNCSCHTDTFRFALI